MCELLIAKGANVDALDRVSDRVMVNGERGEGKGNARIFYAKLMLCCDVSYV